MHLPKQSIPVLRNFNSVGVSNYRRVNSSGLDTLKRWLNDRGTCECQDLGETTDRNGNYYRDISPKTNHNCKRDYLPQCDQDAGCTCVKSRQVTNQGKVQIPVANPWFV